MEKKVAVIGIGNILMGDEGAGVEVIKQLEKRGCAGDVELIDAGTAFFSIVSDLNRFDKLIIVDVAKGGKKPGTVYRLKMDDIRSGGSSISLHDMGVVESLKLESLVGMVPEEIVFFGIEPKNVELTMEISLPVKRKIAYVVDKIIEEVRK